MHTGRGSSESRSGWWSSLPVVAGPASVVLGALVLLGWTSDMSLLTSVAAGMPAMSPAVALCFVLAGMSLWMLFRDLPSVWPRLLAIILLVLLALAWIGAIPLLTARARAQVGLLALVAFTLEGVALLLMTIPVAAARTAGQQAALASAASGWIGLVGHSFNIDWLADPGARSAMAIHTALGVMLLGSGTAAVERAGGVLGVLRSRGRVETLRGRSCPSCSWRRWCWDGCTWRDCGSASSIPRSASPP